MKYFCNRNSNRIIFRVPSPAEMAEEVYETMSDGGLRSAGSGGLDHPLLEDARTVSVLTLHLGRLALAQISGGEGSALLLDISSLATSLSPDQEYQQFQFRFVDEFKNIC